MMLTPAPAGAMSLLAEKESRPVHAEAISGVQGAEESNTNIAQKDHSVPSKGKHPEMGTYRVLSSPERRGQDEDCAERVLDDATKSGQKYAVCVEWLDPEDPAAEIVSPQETRTTGNVWCPTTSVDEVYATRTSICHSTPYLMTIIQVPTGKVGGHAYGVIEQEFNTEVRKPEWTEYINVTRDGGSGDGLLPMSISISADCAPKATCSQGFKPWSDNTPFPLYGAVDGIWERRWTGNPGPDDFLMGHTLDVDVAGSVPGTGKFEWSKGGQFAVRCDNLIAGFAGCVVPRFRPTYTISDSYPAARDYYGRIQASLPSHPGWEGHGDPLHREADTDVMESNRDKVCDTTTWVKEDHFGGKPSGDPLAIECDEFPFAATKESGAQAGISSGKECQQWTVWPGGSGGWESSDFVAPAYAAPHGDAPCARASMTRRDNGGAGTGLSNFYQNNRVMDSEGFWLASGAGSANTRQKAHTPQSCTLKAPSISNVDADAPPESNFLNYSQTTQSGWTGGDSTYSVKLPDGRTLWMFSDTFLGPENGDGTRPLSAPLVNSSFVVQDGSNLTTITGGTESSPKAILPPRKPGYWYWLGGGKITNVDGTNYLQVIFHEWHKFGDGDWEFRHEQNVLATFSLANLKEPLSVRQLPSTTNSTTNIQWGSGILPSTSSGDGYTYIYGVDDEPYQKSMHIARVRGGDLGGIWEFFDKSNNRWVLFESGSDGALTGVANEYSVTPWNGEFMLLTQDSMLAFNAEVYAYVSCDPAGSFVSKTLVYKMPETGLWGSYNDGEVYAYNAHVHPVLTQNGNRFTFSYNVNHLDTRVSPDGAHYRDTSIYKPRWVSFSVDTVSCYSCLRAN
ncbi:DUF5005 domain-containing protein [Streptomyces aculeolatus]